VGQTEDLAGGVFTATVQTRRTAVVLLKASYDPSWRARVDGASAKPVMMAPSLVGVEVGPGRHVVRFRYASYPDYPLLLAIGILTALALTILPRRTAFRRLNETPTRNEQRSQGGVGT
jgi:uncharacterized membrane protein YfhO